jgi:hypothetical protein
MEPAAFFVVLIPIGIIVAIVIRFAAGGLDQDRVKQYVEQRGGKLLTAEWSPFGPGWFGEKSDRIYQVRYLDVDGTDHEEVESLEEENRRLREELARLRRKEQDSDKIQE